MASAQRAACGGKPYRRQDKARRRFRIFGLCRRELRIIASELREVLAHVTSERDGAAAGHARGEVRVGVGEVGAAVVADHVEPRDGVAFRVDGVHIRVDHDAVHRAEDVARVLGAVEGALVHRRQTEGFLAVVKVVAVLDEALVAFDRRLEGVDREMLLGAVKKETFRSGESETRTSKLKRIRTC